MNVNRALITAASPRQRNLPFQTVVDMDGVPRTTLQILLNEIKSAGIENVCVVVAPGDTPIYRSAAGDNSQRLTFIEQTQPRGHGDAVFRCRDFIGDDAFLCMVGDHLYLSDRESACASQLIEIATRHGCTVSAVQPTHESRLGSFGTVGGRLLPGQSGVYAVDTVIEKPSPTQAEQQLIVPGMRSGFYLCFFGMHVLEPQIMSLLEEQLAMAQGSTPITLTAALGRLVQCRRYLACELSGRRYDIGGKYGLLAAQLALSLAGRDRDEIMTMLLEHAMWRGK